MATFIQDLTLQAMAEDTAYLGQQDPKLTLCPLGIINAYSKDNLATPQVQIDLRQHLTAAWPVLLDQLRERNIPIPQQLQTPHFFGMSETVCVTTTRKALEVSAWMRQWDGWLNGTDDEGNLLPLAEGELSVFTPQSGYMLKSDLTWDGSGKVATVKNDGAWVWSNTGTSTAAENRVVRLPAGTVIKAVASINDNKVSMTYTTLPDTDILILYPLADPIRIQYSDLGLPDINSGMIGITTDHILTLSDTDGLEMHRLEPVDWTDEEGNTHPALITRWSKAYMDKHHAWPPALPMKFTGLQFTADYKEMRWLHDTVLKLINKYPV